MGRISNDLTKIDMSVDYIFEEYSIRELKVYVEELRRSHENDQEAIERLVRETAELEVKLGMWK